MGTLTLSELDRAGIVRRGRNLEILTILWAGFEAGIALFTAFQSKSLSLAGFGFDSDGTYFAIFPSTLAAKSYNRC